MKAILLSIKPKWVAKILNGEKTIEVRKLFPKNYVGWVYLYCSNKHNGWCMVGINGHTSYYEKYSKESVFNYDTHRIGNGRVVARFWCDKVENVGRYNVFEYGTETITPYNFNSMTCLRDDQIREYLGNSKKLFAIHISKLEIFDKPRELSEFSYYIKRANRVCYLMPIYLTKAPQNYCYIEGE